MKILSGEIEGYLKRLATESAPVPAEMEAYADRRGFPIVGPLVGRILCQLALLAKAKRILEMGSGFGYSAYWFAQAMDSDGEIILTEGDSANLERARTYLERAGVRPRRLFLHGDALELVEGIEGRFDIVFIDVDKHQYPQAFKKAVPRLSPNGLLIADNTLWSGKVVDPSPGDADTAGILEFNRLAFSDPRLLSVILPVRDGVAVSLRRSAV